MPFCLDQSDLNASGILITTFQIIDANFSKGFDCTIWFVGSFVSVAQTMLNAKFRFFRLEEKNVKPTYDSFECVLSEIC